MLLLVINGRMSFFLSKKIKLFDIKINSINALLNLDTPNE
jgi:hypothetical protein